MRKNLMTLTVIAGGKVTVMIGGTGKATIRWGNGAIIETELSFISSRSFTNEYPSPFQCKITITGENITYLVCSNNQLTGLDVSKNKNLMFLNCSNNELTKLDVSKNIALKGLFCMNNQLTSLDVSNNIELKELFCRDNEINSLDISNNVELASLFCMNNQITSLNFSRNSELKYLTCRNNQLTSLDISNNKKIENFDCRKNQIANLFINNNGKIKIKKMLYDDSTNLIIVPEKAEKKDKPSYVKKDKGEKKITMRLHHDGELLFWIAGSGIVLIDWGDGSPEEKSKLTKNSKHYCHSYTDTSARTITITSKNITYLECRKCQLSNLDASKTELTNLIMTKSM